MSNNSNSRHNFYEQIYNDYKTKIFNCQEKYYDWYRKANNLLEAIEKAFKSEDEWNKVHSHQCNVGRVVLKQATEKALEIYQEKNLLEKDLNTFDKIYKFVNSVREEIYRFGELAHYDVSLRIAKYQDTKYPGCGYLKEVYLHAGTLEGAKAILDAGDMDKNIQKSDIEKESKINIDYFPYPLNKLSGDHLENLLCIYKQELKKQKIFSEKQKFCINSPKIRKVKACYNS